MDYTLPHVETSYIDGLPVIWTERPGPTSAGLVFATGWADETLLTSGYAHLIEHLSLAPFVDSPLALNGCVEPYRTTFTVTGEREEVLQYLKDLTYSLDNMPAARLGTECDILRQEAKENGLGLADLLGVVRHGATGTGLHNYEQFGLRSVSFAVLDDWRKEHFTRGNAVLWMTSAPPTTFDLELPEGPKPLAQRATLTDHAMPALVDGPKDGLAFSCLLPSGPSAHIGWWVLAQRIEASLRHDRGWTYEVDSDDVAFDADSREFLIVVGVPEARRDEALTKSLEILLDLLDTGPTEEELDRYRDGVARWHRDPANLISVLEDVVTRTLNGWPNTSCSGLLDDLRQVKVSDVKQALSQATSTLIVAGPEELSVGDIVLKPVANSDHPFEGEEIKHGPSLIGDERASLIIADQGITLAYKGGDTTSIAYEDVVAYERFTNSMRMVHARNSSLLVLHPEMFKGGVCTLDRLDRIIPAGVQVSREALELDDDEREELAIDSPPTIDEFLRLRRKPVLGGALVTALFGVLPPLVWPDVTPYLLGAACVTFALSVLYLWRWLALRQLRHLPEVEVKVSSHAVRFGGEPVRLVTVVPRESDATFVMRYDEFGGTWLDGTDRELRARSRFEPGKPCLITTADGRVLDSVYFLRDANRYEGTIRSSTNHG